MTMEVSTFGLITQPPTDNEIHGCQNIPLSDEFNWYPSKNLFKFSLMDEEYRTSLNFHQYIDIVENRAPCAPLTIQCRDDSLINEFDRAMSNISIGLAQELMMERLIRKVRVKRKRSGFANCTDKQHHGIRTDILERKWEIGLDKSKRTLQ